ncbi:MAG: glycosyltransferase [Paludibacteraceae bacterium]|nr:glycosyltransferase [Paludibacteraceae bacterium]
MKVSVLMPTYNHEKTIAQAIESFLAQRCTFPIELCICDDASTDATPKIAAKYQQQYPNQITFIAKPVNQGLMRNYQTLLSVAKGQYLSILESDDYWTDPLKLQKQVDFLDANEEYGLSFTRVSFWQDGVLKQAKNVEEVVAKHANDLYSYMLLRSIIYSPTTCFRRSFLDAYCNVDEYVRLDFKTFDYPVWLSLARFSKVHYLPDDTAVYRISGASISNTSDVSKRLKFELAVIKIRHYVIGLYGTGCLSLRAIRRREAVVSARILWRHKRPLHAAYYFFATLLGIVHGDKQVVAKK